MNPPKEIPPERLLGGGIGDGALVCKRCGCRHFETIGTYPTSAGFTRRYKRCRHCGRQIKTLEKVDEMTK